MDIQLGNRTIRSVSDTEARIAMLLWGESGCGKTTLASTAPGQKLWILFDPDGEKSLKGRNDVHVLDLSSERYIIAEQFKSDNPLGIEKMLTEHVELQTLVFDSATTFQYLATQAAVASSKNSTLELPGMNGYTYRNAVVLRVVSALLSLTKRLQRNIIIIAHEGTPNKDKEGHVLSTPPSLSEALSNQIGIRLSEIWWMFDAGKVNERTIAIRPTRSRSPMKTRMFDGGTAKEFPWRYNPNTWSGDGIESWFEAWKAGGSKLAIPK